MVLAITPADFKAAIDDCLKLAPAGRCKSYAAHGSTV